MPNFNITPSIAPKFNQGQRHIACFLAPAGVVNADTFTLTAPTGVPKDAIPTGAWCFSGATPALPIALAVTSHNKTTGVTVITATAAPAVGLEVFVEYISV